MTLLARNSLLFDSSFIVSEATTMSCVQLWLPSRLLSMSPICLRYQCCPSLTLKRRDLSLPTICMTDCPSFFVWLCRRVRNLPAFPAVVVSGSLL